MEGSNFSRVRQSWVIITIVPPKEGDHDIGRRDGLNMSDHDHDQDHDQEFNRVELNIQDHG